MEMGVKYKGNVGGGEVHAGSVMELDFIIKCYTPKMDFWENTGSSVQCRKPARASSDA